MQLHQRVIIIAKETLTGPGLGRRDVLLQLGAIVDTKRCVPEVDPDERRESVPRMYAGFEANYWLLHSELEAAIDPTFVVGGCVSKTVPAGYDVFLVADPPVEAKPAAEQPRPIEIDEVIVGG